MSAARVGVALRSGWRLLRVGLHLGTGLATLAWVYPRVAPATRLRLKQRWSAGLLRRLGVELQAVGREVQAGGMLVANHVSWLDIFAINALSPAAFVCKDEVRRWPVIGWLCARSDSIFLTRGSAREARAVGAEIAAVLAGGAAVAVFPEGTTSDGEGLLPFRPALLQAAIAPPVSVQALLIRYRRPDGTASAAPVYAGATTLFESLRAIAAEPVTQLRVVGLDAVDPQGMDRRQLVACLESALRAALQREPGVSAQPAQAFAGAD